MAPFNQRNNTVFFDGLVHHFYMERLAFCTLIKHKTDLQRIRIPLPKTSFLFITKPVPLNSAQKFEMKKK